MDVTALLEENTRLREENAQLRRENEELCQEVAKLKAQVEQLMRLLEEARRSGKRQAAPFSRGERKSKPAKPGRKAGAKYSKQGGRKPPAKIDTVLEAELPGCCPNCGGAVEETDVVSQYQTEIPQPQVEQIEFHVHVGRCRNCGQRVQGRHPRQSSDAVGAAASQLGPQAVALGTLLNKRYGLSHGKTAAVFETVFGLQVSRGGLSQAFARLADKAEPTYEKLIEQVRSAPSVTPDETGWRVGGKRQWMWAFSTETATVYSILPGRGIEQAKTILGEDFDGFLVRDGWAAYRSFDQATHQTCLAHLLRRCRESIEASPPGEAELAQAVKAILQRSLGLRDRREQQQIDERGMAIALGRLEADMDRILEQDYESAEDKRLVKHLTSERDALFTFLHCPGLEATNFRAEQAIRPMAVNRKVWGGNRTENGARTHSILGSILHTCQQQLRPATELLQQILRLRAPMPIDLLPLQGR